jgi:hypothetical protein
VTCNTRSLDGRFAFSALSFRVVQIVALLESSTRKNDGVQSSVIATSLGKSWQHIDRCLATLVHPLFDDRRPWLCRQLRGGVRLTEQGWLMLDAISSAPYAVPAAQGYSQWVERVRWPWLEADSKRNAVVPSGKGGAYCADPETAASRTNKRLCEYNCSGHGY